MKNFLHKLVNTNVTEYLGYVAHVVMTSKPIPDVANVFMGFVAVSLFALAIFINFAL